MGQATRSMQQREASAALLCCKCGKYVNASPAAAAHFSLTLSFYFTPPPSLGASPSLSPFPLCLLPSLSPSTSRTLCSSLSLPLLHCCTAFARWFRLLCALCSVCSLLRARMLACSRSTCPASLSFSPSPSLPLTPCLSSTPSLSMPLCPSRSHSL